MMTEFNMGLFREKYHVYDMTVTRDDAQEVAVWMNMSVDGTKKLIQDLYREPIDISSIQKGEYIDPDAIYLLKYNSDSISLDELNNVMRFLNDNQIHAIALPASVDLIELSAADLKCLRQQIDDMIACSDYDELTKRSKSK